MDLQNTEDSLIFLMVMIMIAHVIYSLVNKIYRVHQVKRKRKRKSLYKDLYKDSFFISTSKNPIFHIEIIIVVLYISTFLVSTDNTEYIDISSRIENISQGLAESSAELSNIQKELEERIQYVEELKAEAEIAENVISLTDEQLNAVQAKLNQQLEASSTKGMIQNILVAAFFFVLGYIVQLILNWNKRKNSRTAENRDVTSHTQYSIEEIEHAIMLLDTIKQKENSTKE